MTLLECHIWMSRAFRDFSVAVFPRHVGIFMSLGFPFCVYEGFPSLSLWFPGKCLHCRYDTVRHFEIEFHEI